MAAYCLKINHLPQGDKKIKHEVFISFGNVVPANTMFYSSLTFPRDLY